MKMRKRRWCHHGMFQQKVVEHFTSFVLCRWLVCTDGVGDNTSDMTIAVCKKEHRVLMATFVQMLCDVVPKGGTIFLSIAAVRCMRHYKSGLQRWML